MTTPDTWRIGGDRVLDLARPAVMGILNVTPDSFSDGGRHTDPDQAARAAHAMLDDGAAIIDIGGESTRPGSQPVDASEQIRRVLPVIERLMMNAPSAIISIDTTLADVARAAIEAGAAIVNDVSGGTHDPAMLTLVAQAGVGFIAMHRLTTPELDSYSDTYDKAPLPGDITKTVGAFLAERLRIFEDAGGSPAAVVLDPGLGFGKTVEQNLELIRDTQQVRGLRRPILSGLSRKSFVGRVSLDRDSDPSERLAGTIALTALHRAAGAAVFRVHDVGPCVQALRATDALQTTK